ncbi:MAG: hypothetical protein DMD29_01720 [Gemmatimonadetes bacterium]|nr:MAG: hypothetical protein DMD29_01720 [Gemmatimonadota bacterium]
MRGLVLGAEPQRTGGEPAEQARQQDGAERQGAALEADAAGPRRPERDDGRNLGRRRLLPCQPAQAENRQVRGLGSRSLAPWWRRSASQTS